MADHSKFIAWLNQRTIDGDLKFLGSATTYLGMDCGPSMLLRQSERSESGPLARRGSAFHDAADAYIKHLIATESQTDLQHGWNKVLDPAIRKWKVPPSLQPELRRWWERWVDRFILPPAAMVIGSEVGVVVDRDLNPQPFDPALVDHHSGDKDKAVRQGLFFRMAADLVTCEEFDLEVTDWKCSPHVPSETDLRDSPQAFMYLAVLGMQLGIDEDEDVLFRQHHVPWGKSVDVHWTLRECIDKTRAWWRTHMAVEKRSPMHEYWRTYNATSQCQYCPLRDGTTTLPGLEPCPVWKGDTEAGSLILTLRGLETLRKDALQVLSARAKIEPVRAYGFKAHYAEAPRRNINPVKLFAWLEKREELPADPLYYVGGGWKALTTGKNKLTEGDIEELEAKKIITYRAGSKFEVVVDEEDDE